MEKATEQEIEKVAAAMWNSGPVDGRPSWDDLDPADDLSLINEFKEQARAGIDAFVALRTTT